MKTRTNVFNILNKIPTGTAIVNATAASCPVSIANPPPTIVAILTSIDTDIPMFITPMNANSKVAPMMIPCVKSPQINPTIGPNTIGLPTNMYPLIISVLANK
ncbi:hypothetical protein SDC9_170822 [bioreactor metagenome]|uniref:Uncharacterized protein n=1 Tax=bioreactor metagenome TaxID=1076179 RepID=A0A645GHW0_9ZZZZ